MDHVRCDNSKTLLLCTHSMTNLKYVHTHSAHAHASIDVLEVTKISARKKKETQYSSINTKKKTNKKREPIINSVF